MESLSPSGAAVDTATLACGVPIISIRLSLSALVDGIRVCVGACMELAIEVSREANKSTLTYLEGLFDMVIGPGCRRYVAGWSLASRSRCGVK